MRIFLLPAKSIYQLNELPAEAGVYYVTAFWVLFYVGQAKNLRSRWRKNHQRYNQFKLHYKVMPQSEITAYEKAEIQHYKPIWNQSRVPDFFGLLGLFVAVWLRVLVYSLMILALVAIAIYLVWFL
jgi:hypothetical protein